MGCTSALYVGLIAIKKCKEVIKMTIEDNKRYNAILSPYIIGKLVEHNSRLRINDNSLIALVLYYIDSQHCGLDWTTQKRLYTLPRYQLTKKQLLIVSNQLSQSPNGLRWRELIKEHLQEVSPNK